MGPKKASPKKASPKVAGVKRKTPSEETTDVEGACAALGTEPEPKKATLDVGSAAKGGDTGVQRAGLTANNGEAPTMPSQSDIESGMAIQVKEYMKALVPYVHAGLTAFLRLRDPNFKGLAEAKPFEITSDAKVNLKTFRESWQMENCLRALNSTQIYEAAGNVFWLDVLGDKFGEHPLMDAEVTWHRLQNAAAIWSEQAFVASSEDPQHRRFVFPGYLPAAIANTSHIEAAVKAGIYHFNKLCCLGGHAIIYAWYVALADALGGGLDRQGRSFKDLEVV